MIIWVILVNVDGKQNNFRPHCFLINKSCASAPDVDQRQDETDTQFLETFEFRKNTVRSGFFFFFVVLCLLFTKEKSTGAQQLFWFALQTGSTAAHVGEQHRQGTQETKERTAVLSFEGRKANLWGWKTCRVAKYYSTFFPNNGATSMNLAPLHHIDIDDFNREPLLPAPGPRVLWRTVVHASFLEFWWFLDCRFLLPSPGIAHLYWTRALVLTLDCLEFTFAKYEFCSGSNLFLSLWNTTTTERVLHWRIL